MTTTVMNWVSPATMHALGWALLHFVWQGTALAALAAAAMALCHRASARYALGIAALVLMLIAPLATFMLYAQGHSGVADTAKSSPLAAAAWTAARDRAAASGSISAAPSGVMSAFAPSLDALPWLVEAWLLGVAFFSLRSAGGFLLIERERRRQSAVVSPRILEICYTLQARLGLSRAVSYCESKWLQAPAVIGWFRPIVFLPVSAITGLSEEQLQAVIAHELAHIQRLDPFVNVFQVGVETLLFYHPAVWWLNKKIRAERECCCDEVAVSLCGNPIAYARALTMMEEWRSAPVFAMAANRGPLKERIVRVLGLKTFSAGMRGIGWTGSVLCLSAALFAGNALLGITHTRPVHANFSALATPALASDPAQQAMPAAKSPRAAKPSASSSATPSADATATADSDSHSSSASSYIDRMKAAGLGDLSLDILIALKTQDVTPEYVRAMRDLGLHLDAEKLIAMRVQGIDPEYVRATRDSGLNPTEDQLIALKVQDVDAAYYRDLKKAGIDPDLDRLIAMKVQGVTPEYVNELRATGLNLTVDQVIGLKVQDVTPKYVNELRAAGLTVTADKVIALKVQDVTPEYLKGLRDQGLDASADSAIAMRVQDVTPEYVKAIRALGLNPSANQFIAMRVQDVTPEYIKGLQAAGFKLDINDIIGAKVQDVTPEFIESARRHGFKDLTLQKLIQLRQLGILDSDTKTDI
jgi:beta-lactamase regulating signal transducer with metallopeptidase domain